MYAETKMATSQWLSMKMARTASWPQLLSSLHWQSCGETWTPPAICLRAQVDLCHDMLIATSATKLIPRETTLDSILSCAERRWLQCVHPGGNTNCATEFRRSALANIERKPRVIAFLSLFKDSFFSPEAMWSRSEGSKAYDLCVGLFLEDCVLVSWAFLVHTGLFAPRQTAFGFIAAEIGPSAHMATSHAYCGSVTMCIADTRK